MTSQTGQIKKLQLVVGCHHQALLGQPDAALEDEYQRHHRPYLSLLNAFPEVSVALHYAGPWLEWFDAHHPEFIMLLREMVQRRQVEMVGGAYYDAALSIIPNADRLGQIEKLTTHLRSQFGTRPRGSTLAEGVWEPSLASTLHSSGMEYVFLTAAQLDAGGVSASAQRGPLLTEDQGRVVSLLPITTTLLVAAPRQTTAQLVAELRAAAEEGSDPVAVAFDAGGPSPALSPVERTAWLTDLFQQLLAADWVQFTLPQQLLAARPLRPRVYLNSSTRSDASGSRALFRGNLVRSAESRLLYARMMYTHLLVNQIRGDKARKRSAQNELWRGQSHCAYWNGAGGGIRHAAVRHDAYRSFIEAEKTARDQSTFEPGLVATDFDLDGLPECLFHGKVFNAYVHRRAGSIVELDYLATSRNYQATLDGRVANRDSNEPPPLASFRDRFATEFKLEDMLAGDLQDSGDFVDGAYQAIHLDREGLSVTLLRDGGVTSGGDSVALRVQKRFRFRGRSIGVDYRLENHGAATLRIRHAVELNFAFADPARLTLAAHSRGLAAGEAGGKGFSAKQPARIPRGDGLRMLDSADGVALTLMCRDAADLLTCPIATAEGYQNTAVLACWDLQIEAGGVWENEIGLAFSRLRQVAAR